MTFSVPLSVTSCKGVLCLGIISSNSKCAMVSALLSGTGKASAQPEYQSTNPTTYLLPDNVLWYGPATSRPIFAKG